MKARAGRRSFPAEGISARRTTGSRTISVRRLGIGGEADHVIRPIVDRDLSLVWQLPPAGPVNIQLSYPH